MTLLRAFQLLGLQIDREASNLLPWLHLISWEAFRLLSLQRSNQSVVLCEAFLQGTLWTVVFVSLCAAELQGGFQPVMVVALNAVEAPRFLQTMVLVAQLSCVQKNGMPSSCDVFSGADKLLNSFSVALGAVFLLGCLPAVVLVSLRAMENLGCHRM